MPELPEVQTVVSTLSPRVTGRLINRVIHLRDDMVTPTGFDLRSALAGRIIRDISRRAKRIVFRLDDQNSFFVHLGMTGRLTVEPREKQIEAHTHLRIDLGQDLELRFRDPRRFGEIRWLGQQDAGDALGPEPLTMRASQLEKNLRKTTRSIKNALMDQSVVAGLGNIYVDESLFEASLHPLKPANKLNREQTVRLTRAIKQVLRRAIRHRGSTLRDYVDADGNGGKFQRLHKVYGREDKPCRACKTPITRIVIGGRSTHFCSRCQPMKRQQINHAGKKSGRS